MKNSAKGCLYSIIAATCFGFQPFLASFVYDYGIGSRLLSFFRVFCVIPIFLIIVLLKREPFWRISFRQFIQIVFLALTGGALTMLLLFEAFCGIATGTAIALNFSYPVIVLILGIVFCRERVTRPLMISMFLCMTGVCLFCDIGGLFSWRGFFLALASGFTYGVYVFFLEKSCIMETMGFMSYTFWFFLLSAIILIPVVFLSGDLGFSFPAGGWLYILIFSIEGGVLATVLLQAGVQKIGSRKASILQALEPVTSIAAGSFLLGEPLRWNNILGTVFIILSTIVLILGGNRTSAKKTDPKETSSG